MYLVSTETHFDTNHSFLSFLENTLHTCSAVHRTKVSGGILWSNMHWWIVCLAIISVVRDHMSTPHPSHTDTYTNSPYRHSNPHISFSTWDLILRTKKTRTHVHLSFTPPPQQRWPLHLHLCCFYTHTQQGREKSSAPHPPWLCRCFIKCHKQCTALQCSWKHVLELFTSRCTNYYKLQ